MRSTILVAILASLVVGCVESAPESQSTSNGNNQSNELPSVDCSDCEFESFQMVPRPSGTLPSRVSCYAPQQIRPFSRALAAWQQGGVLRAIGTSCVDYSTPNWTEGELAWLFSQGFDVEARVLDDAAVDDNFGGQSECSSDSFVYGVRILEEGGVIRAIQALCARYQIEAISDNGVRGPRVKRTGTAPGAYVPQGSCDGCAERTSTCSEDRIGIGFQVPSPDKLDELEILCADLGPVLTVP